MQCQNGWGAQPQGWDRCCNTCQLLKALCSQASWSAVTRRLLQDTLSEANDARRRQKRRSRQMHHQEHVRGCTVLQVDKLMALRKQINEALAASSGGKLSVNDFIVKASALVRSPSAVARLRAHSLRLAIHNWYPLQMQALGLNYNITHLPFLVAVLGKWL